MNATLVDHGGRKPRMWARLSWWHAHPKRQYAPLAMTKKNTTSCSTIGLCCPAGDIIKLTRQQAASKKRSNSSSSVFSCFRHVKPLLLIMYVVGHLSRAKPSHHRKKKMTKPLAKQLHAHFLLTHKTRRVHRRSTNNARPPTI